MQTFIKLRVAGEQLDLTLLKEVFKTGETHVCKKGDVYYNKYAKEEIVYNEDVFTLEKVYTSESSITVAISGFVSELLQNKKVIKETVNNNHISLCISLYPDDYYQNISLTRDILENVNFLGIEMNLEVYFLKDIYEGNY